MGHADEPMLREAVGDPAQAVVLLHGRGASADGMLDLGHAVAADALLLAPQAADNEWYPESFLEPREQNQPWLDEALNRVGDALAAAADAGFPPGECTLVGFSQGACLATEYAARHPQRFSAVAALSGGLIGDTVAADDYDGTVDGTPIFLACDTDDPYVPVERVQVTADVFEQLGGFVTTHLVQGMEHTVTDHERDVLRDHLDG